ncbi:type II toxin-antitoxin system RelE/ParE family toxin [Candidatus Micrarchaeota archaeon]|nr:type II toxin-antitoxin system RelE/ParE family toxin [Candidatus Micrarchaeota archaeon]
MPFTLIFKEQFEKSFSDIKDDVAKVQIWKKIQQLKEHAPIGKKLIGNPYWSIHVGRFRVIYILHAHSSEIELIDILERKHDYRELR